MESGFKSVAFEWCEAKDVVGAGVFGKNEANPALAEAAGAVVKDMFVLSGLFAWDPGGIEGEKMDEEHADGEVGEGDGGEYSDVEADEAEPEPGAQTADECEWEREQFEGECGVGECLEDDFWQAEHQVADGAESGEWALEDAGECGAVLPGGADEFGVAAVGISGAHDEPCDGEKRAWELPAAVGIGAAAGGPRAEGCAGDCGVEQEHPADKC